MALGKKTGGRRPGTKNRHTPPARRAIEKVSAELSEIAAKKLADVIPEIFSGDAHAFLMSVYKDPSQPPMMRLDAAAKAIRYEKPSLQAIAMTGAVTINLINEILSELDGRSRGVPALEDFAGRPRMAS